MLFPLTGNTFSTLRGHRFDWLLLRDEEATHQTSEPEAILHFVRFDDSSYETDPIIGALENKGYYGDTVLVEGVSTGTAKVSVRFVDRVWKVWGMGTEDMGMGVELYVYIEASTMKFESVTENGECINWDLLR